MSLALILNLFINKRNSRVVIFLPIWMPRLFAHILGIPPRAPVQALT